LPGLARRYGAAAQSASHFARTAVLSRLMETVALSIQVEAKLRHRGTGRLLAFRVRAERGRSPWRRERLARPRTHGSAAVCRCELWRRRAAQA